MAILDVAVEDGQSYKDHEVVMLRTVIILENLKSDVTFASFQTAVQAGGFDVEWAKKFDTRWTAVPTGDAVGTKQGVDFLFEKLPEQLRDGTSLS